MSIPILALQIGGEQPACPGRTDTAGQRLRHFTGAQPGRGAGARLGKGASPRAPWGAAARAWLGEEVTRQGVTRWSLLLCSEGLWGFTGLSSVPVQSLAQVGRQKNTLNMTFIFILPALPGECKTTFTPDAKPDLPSS